jgi:general secretion pathway protein F
MSDACFCVPVVGGLLREILTLASPGCSALCTVLAIVRDVVGNHAAMAVVDAAATSARALFGLAGPLGEARVFPPRTTHLQRPGEENAEPRPDSPSCGRYARRAHTGGSVAPGPLLVPAITIMGITITGIVIAAHCDAEP